MHPAWTATSTSSPTSVQLSWGEPKPVLSSGDAKTGEYQQTLLENALLSTDLETGETTRRFDVEGKSTDSASSTVVFTPTEVVQLVDNNDGSEFRIIGYDRDTGQEKSRTVLTGLADELPRDLIPHGFAVRREPSSFPGPARGLAGTLLGPVGAAMGHRIAPGCR